MKQQSIGIIAEDSSDLDVVRELIKKVAGRSRYSIQHFVGNGCGKIKTKCTAWALNLKSRKCTSLILLRDLDANILPTLRGELTLALGNCPINNHIIVIPVREIEAWLLADHHAIQTALNIKKVKRVSNPESINRPKEHLRDLIYLKSNKSKNYINTIHNRQIASHIELGNILRCKSYSPLHMFVQLLFKKGP